MYSCKHPGSLWSHFFLCGFSVSTCTERLPRWMGELEEGRQVGPSSKRTLGNSHKSRGVGVPGWPAKKTTSVQLLPPLSHSPHRCDEETTEHSCSQLGDVSGVHSVDPLQADHKQAISCLAHPPSHIGGAQGRQKQPQGNVDTHHVQRALPGKCPPAVHLQCSYLPSWCS